MGLPMLNGFVGEFLILLGTFQMHANWASWAAIGVILSACYLLWAYQRVFFGDITVEKNRALPDTSSRELGILATMAVITLWMGVGSTFFTHRIAASSQNVLDQMQRSNPQEACLGRPGTPGCAPVSPGSAASVAHWRTVLEQPIAQAQHVAQTNAVILTTSDKDVRSGIPNRGGRTSMSAPATASTTIASTSTERPGSR
jgi:formate hydrogenlyase subunit 3/multisubunit Na+/H+ antiporter MnhD subunit